MFLHKMAVSPSSLYSGGPTSSSEAMYYVKCTIPLNSGLELYDAVKLSAIKYSAQTSFRNQCFHYDLNLNTLNSVVIYLALKLCTPSVPQLPDLPARQSYTAARLLENPPLNIGILFCLHKSFYIRMSSLSICFIEKRYVLNEIRKLS